LTKERAVKRRVKVLLISLAAAVASVTVPIGGPTLLGFSYRSVENNELTVCPDWVIVQAGDVITLTTGERFRVADQTPEDITRALLVSNAWVKIDRSKRMGFIRHRTASCGNRPEQRQWLTIPIHAAETSQTYFADEFASIEPLPGTTNGSK
jgi:hypothetical protein